MARILVICDQGNNRSVTIASQIKYSGHDVLTAGLKTNELDTFKMLMDWADRVIVTAEDQFMLLEGQPKVELWNVGPDVYPRPFNKELLAITRKLIKEHL